LLSAAQADAQAPHGHEYRPDIDGLRAVAVLAVIGFHLELTGFRAGFVGVDVFFVISGYLISGIIVRSLERRSFSFAEFYTRRINRIFPALITVLVTSTIIGWAILFGSELRTLGKHVASGAGFLANFVFLREVGYFDLPAKPLLHLWSLAVEEQFYFAWPLLAWIAFKRRWSVGWTLIALIEISFVANVWSVRHGSPSVAFYMPLSRFWEILAGAALAYVERDGRKRALPLEWIGGLREMASLAGAVLLAITAVGVNEKTPWPGLWALPAVGGTLLLVASGPNSLLARKLLANRILVGIGLISYPLYLWHWPFIVFARIVNGAAPSAATGAWIVAASLLLSVATFRYIERPIRFGKHKRRSATLLLPAMAAVALIGVAMWKGAIAPRLDRYSAIADALDDKVYLHGGINSSTGHIVDASLPGNDGRKVVFFGDSHMEHYWPRIVELTSGGGPHPAVRFLTNDGCPPLPGLTRTGLRWDGVPYRCDVYYREAMKEISRSEVNVVVLASFWESYLESPLLHAVDDSLKRPLGPGDARLNEAFAQLERDLSALHASGKKLYIILSNPTAPAFDPHSMLPGRLPGQHRPLPVREIAKSDFLRYSGPTAERLRRVAEGAGATVIDPVDFMRGTTTCPTVYPD
jgi:peptidoglycan/LPS O-acetylase OafA/YrhL